jgi:hypothetical protein
MHERNAVSVTTRREEMQGIGKFDDLMTMSQDELLAEFLCILLRPSDELTDEDRADIKQIDEVFRVRRIAASA